MSEALEALRGKGLLRGRVPLRPDVVLEQALLAAEQQVTAQRTALHDARREVHDLVELYVGGIARSERTLEVARLDTGTHGVQTRSGAPVASASACAVCSARCRSLL